MSGPVILPKAPKTDDQKYAAAIVERLDAAVVLLRTLLGRVPPAQEPDPTLGGGMQRRLVSEPATPGPPRMAQPVAEPAGREGPPPPAAPPSRPARNAATGDWAAYADALGLGLPADAARGDIIAAVDAHTTKPAKRRR